MESAAIQQVAVIGAGAMGAGIAQCAAAAGCTVHVLDATSERTRAGIDGIAANLARLVDKGRLQSSQREQVLARIRAASGSTDLAASELVIEAVIEDFEAKVRILTPIAQAAPTALFASNTSSLSISKLGAALQAATSQPDFAHRFAGMHFFNPAPLMPLVEVISGTQTAAQTLERVEAAARGWGKTTVRAADTPGFIVNRVARGYYLEALRMLGEGIAGVSEIDATLKRLGGFRMGPFELMDLIGIDVNYSVSCSVYEQLGSPARLRPHEIQAELARNGHVGRKSGRGFYDYGSPAPIEAYAAPRRSFELQGTLYEAVRRVAERGAAATGSSTEQYIFARILVTIMNEAALLVDQGAATESDVDTAMKLGTNYPDGPLAWARRVGPHTVAGLLRELDGVAGDGRFAPAAWFSGG